MDELDDEQHMPEGVESAVWQRLVQARRQKLDSEQQVRLPWIIRCAFIKILLYSVSIKSKVWIEVSPRFVIGSLGWVLVLPWKRSKAL